MNRKFGLNSYSLYDEQSELLESAIGFAGGYKDKVDSPAFLEMARASEKIYLIKTHGPPLADDPAIYIVRDGRAAVASYAHYLSKVEGYPVDIPQVIAGDVGFGSWSGHFYTWDPVNRPNTVLTTYETMLEDVDLWASQVEGLLGASANQADIPAFDELKERFPFFYRVGGNEPGIAEIQPYLDEFDRLHGDLMKELGYY
ncbi:hypothetical protein J2S73_001610 [Amorphus orientalis]|uniref:Sulfotransferase domain-containing protein n=1 Tax=Amorphus orientalis TaxID=649198 RepID=A0AAE3VNH1_9HYPH|nr:hypothetical protein [Amorphus orientalis]